MHGLFTLSFLLNTLKEAGKIEDSTVQAVAQYIKQCQMKSDGTFVNSNTKIGEFVKKTLIFISFLIKY